MLRRQAVLIPGGALVGLTAGAASAGFLRSLEWATEAQASNTWLLWLLPVAGATMATITARYGGRASAGNRLTMTQIHAFGDGVPLRMAPLVYVGTIVTHLFGGSAGREGTALQMAAGLTDGVGARLRVSSEDRRLLLIAALAAGFGSVFGVPWAGIVFAVEVAPTAWRQRVVALPAVVVAAVLGDRAVGWLGVHHTAYPEITGVRWRDALIVVLVAPAFGIAAWGFIRLTEGIKEQLTSRLEVPAVRALVGGAVVIALTLLVGNRDYNGLSLPLLGRAFGLVDIGLGVWALKLLFTAVTVGSGYAGGEVTPLFVIGATLGAAVAHATGGPVLVLAAVGMMATFGSAVNASTACVVMGIELFGWGPVVPLIVGCGIARLCSSGRTLYAHETVPVEAELL